MRFQPTRPLRGATISSHHLSAREVFQPTRPLRGATLEALKDRAVLDISTHAPLAGRDNSACWLVSKSRDFNPRAPCGARRMAQETKARPGLISTHAPLAGRDCLRQRRTLVLVLISTHAPLAGRDSCANYSYASIYISTHAPLAGRDPVICSSCRRASYFNPRAPCGARRLRA